MGRLGKTMQRQLKAATLALGHLGQAFALLLNDHGSDNHARGFDQSETRDLIPVETSVVASLHTRRVTAAVLLPSASFGSRGGGPAREGGGKVVSGFGGCGIGICRLQYV